MKIQQGFFLIEFIVGLLLLGILLAVINEVSINLMQRNKMAVERGEALSVLEAVIDTSATDVSLNNQSSLKDISIKKDQDHFEIEWKSKTNYWKCSSTKKIGYSCIQL